MTFRIIICDDDPNMRTSLRKMILEYFKSAGCSNYEFFLFDSGEALLESDVEGDIAFLDVEMGGLSGIHTGEQLKKRCPRIKIIVVTSFPDYLDEAMQFHVFRYLSKPVDKNRLFRNLKDAIYQISTYTKPIVVETVDGFKTVYAESIVCFESDKRCTLIHTEDGVIINKFGIDFWKKSLDVPCFYVASRSHIVNMKYVSGFTHDHIELNCERYSLNAYLSRRKYSDFKETYMLYIKSTI